MTAAEMIVAMSGAVCDHGCSPLMLSVETAEEDGEVAAVCFGCDDIVWVKDISDFLSEFRAAVHVARRELDLHASA